MQTNEIATKKLAGMAAPYHPRRISDHDLESLRRSMKFFGVVEPVIVNRRTGRVIGGHQRVKAAEAEEIETLPVVTLDLDEPSEKQLNLALNRISGDWNEDALARVLAELQDAGADMELTGFKPGEIEKYLASLRDAPGPDMDEAPALPKNATTKIGDLWKLGEHRILCADSATPAAAAQILDAATPALLLTDPPYGVDYTGGTREALKIKNDALSRGDTGALVSAALAGVVCQMPAGAAAYLCCPAGPRFADFHLAFEAAGLEWHQTLVWRKDAFVLGHADYHFRHEPILYGWTPGQHCAGPPEYPLQHQPILYGWKKGRHYFTADRTLSTVLDIARPKASREHPTMKPVALWAELIGNSTCQGHVVVDPFLGSGTTVMACELLGRRAFGVEIDPRYVDVAVERWQEKTGRKAKRVRGSTRRPVKKRG